MGAAQHIVHLLQGRHQNFPELIEDLGLPVFAPGIHILRQGLKPGTHLNFFQKAVKGQNLGGKIFPVFHAPPQPFQWLRHPGTQVIQLLQKGLVFLSPFLPFQLLLQTLGVLFPGRQPLFSPDAPQIGIVFHPVAFVGGQRGQGRPEILLHGLGLQVPAGLHRRKDGGDDAFLQNVLRARLV